MDILQKYDQENPHIVNQTRIKNLSQGEYSFFMCMVVRLSGGKIQDARHINSILLGFAIFVFLLTTFILFLNFDLFPVKKLSPKDARKQIEEYRKIQPF